MAVDLAPILITFSTVDGLAIILTLFRLFFRLRIQRFWWEDVWAAVMFVFGTAFSVGQLVAFETADYETALVGGWMSTLAFSSTVWAARMSILYSIIRIISPSSYLRKLTRVITVLFLLLWAITIVLKTYPCADDKGREYALASVRLECTSTKVAVFFEQPTKCVSDLALVALSFKLLWRVKLPRRQRRMILSLFSSSALMSMTSLSFTFCYLFQSSIGERISNEMELSVAFIVCNLLVVVTYLYRVILRSADGSLPSEPESSSEDDFTTPVRTSATSQLTTVDLDVTLGTTHGGRTAWGRNDLIGIVTSSSSHC